MRGAGPSAGTQRRRETRMALQKAATIVVEQTGQVISCTLRDIHTRGARISVMAHYAIPDEFMLKSRQEGLDTRARVAWRRGNELGVSFVKA